MYLSRSFKGKVVKGNHEAIYFTSSGSSEKSCTEFTILNNGHSFDFKRMRGKNTSCNPTKLMAFSNWKEGTVMNRRTVLGNFTDTFELEFSGKNAKKTTTQVRVEFNARQQEMKQQ